MSVLLRKAQVGKQEHQARAMSVPKSLRVGLAKVADEVFDMALAVIGVTQERCSANGLGAKLGEETLLLLLDGPKGATGGALLGGELVGALVQQQTMGRIAETPSTQRRMTATDAALCAPMLDALFKHAHDLLESKEDQAALPPFRFGARAESPRLMLLALNASEYNILRLTVDVAAGAFQSQMVFILPVQEVRGDAENVSGEAEPSEPVAILGASVMGLRAELSAVLCRLPVSLSDVSGLRPGDTLAVPGEAFEDVQMMSIDGRVVGSGAIGQVEGQRAIMIDTGMADEEVSQDAMPTTSETDLQLEDSEEPSDYTNLDLPELELPSVGTLIEPNLEGDFPDLPELDADGLPDLPDFPDEGLPDIPEMEELDNNPLSALPGTNSSGDADLEGEFPELEDLQKLNIA